MKPAPPIPEPSPVQTLRKYGLNSTADEVAEVYRQRDELMTALKFYADPSNWKEGESGIGTFPSVAESDGGESARSLLTRINPPQKKG
jgi:hypothetical protein